MTNNSEATTVMKACDSCKLEECKFIHHVRLRGVYQDLCTTCVLRLHPQNFCPTCFQVYPPPTPMDGVLNCTKCYSYTHIHCVESGTTSPPTPYVCPLCVNSNTLIFKLKTVQEVNLETGSNYSGAGMVMDTDASKKFVAASKISNLSMCKAVRAEKVEAEKRGREAIMTKKRARESLEYVAYLVMKDKLRKVESVSAGNDMVQVRRVDKLHSSNIPPNEIRVMASAMHVDGQDIEDEELFVDIETRVVQTNYMENA